MATTVKKGWLQDKNGDKFAPKTLVSQVQTSDGILLEDKIQADLEAFKDEVLDSVSDTAVKVDTALSSTSTNPVANSVIKSKFDELSDAINEIESNAADTNYYHTPSSTSGIKIATGTGVRDLYVPTGTSSTTVAAGNHTHSGYAPAYSYGMSDLDPEEDSLTTGKLYFVYE